MGPFGIGTARDRPTSRDLICHLELAISHKSSPRVSEAVRRGLHYAQLAENVRAAIIVYSLVKWMNGTKWNKMMQQVSIERKRKGTM